MSKRHSRGTAKSLSVSQNFLTSAATIRRILRRTSITERDHVVEIGAGKGHITRELVRVCRSVEAYELDGTLYRQLRERLGGEEHLSLRHQDFLNVRLPRIPYKVFSNIPFSITSRIVKKLTTARPLPQDCWLVMEKGAAKRFMGTPRETAASLGIKPFFDAEVVWHFSRRDFHPAPSVDVVLLHLHKKEEFDIKVSQRAAFARFVETGLRYGVDRLLTKKQISTSLRRAGLPDIRASGEILYIQWLCLFRCYQGFGPR